MTEQMKWTGRVVKHLLDGQSSIQFCNQENKALLEQYYEPLTVVATEQDRGKSIRELLVNAFGVSNKLLADARTTEYGLTINEERVYISAPVQPGEVIRLRQLREYSEDILPQSMPLDIVYEDDFILIINKPAGQIVHPTHGHYTNTLANGVVAYWQEKNERFRFRPIHRLDEETSGIVAIAKNAYIHQQLSQQLQEGKVDKRYIAIVYGCPQPEHGIIERAIDRNPVRPNVRMVTEDGAYAKTEYWLERVFHNSMKVISVELNSEISAARNVKSHTVASVVRLKLYTGRTHQIRVHMTSLGHPLIGDKLYNIDEISETRELPYEHTEQVITRHALHAEQLSFYHPISKQYMQWTAPLPVDMQALIKHLEKGI